MEKTAEEICGRIILKETLMELGRSGWIGFFWLRIECSGSL
jgi:hypothetical protein